MMTMPRAPQRLISYEIGTRVGLHAGGAMPCGDHVVSPVISTERLTARLVVTLVVRAT